MVAVRNISTGPRGAWQGLTLVMAEPGQVIEADDFEPEWFEEVEAEEGEGEGLEALKVADLKALAEAEGIDLGDASKKADIISAIELAREAKPAE
jgi:hypothetical protein